MSCHIFSKKTLPHFFALLLTFMIIVLTFIRDRNLSSIELINDYSLQVSTVLKYQHFAIYENFLQHQQNFKETGKGKSLSHEIANHLHMSATNIKNLIGVENIICDNSSLSNAKTVSKIQNLNSTLELLNIDHFERGRSYFKDVNCYIKKANSSKHLNLKSKIEKENFINLAILIMTIFIFIIESYALLIELSYKEKIT